LVARLAGSGVPSSNVALATWAELPDLDEDGALLIAALERVGVSARAAIWDDPAVRWDDFDLVIIRGTWDYISRRDEFLEWARSVPRLANPADILTWNTDKSYLAELAAAGVPVVPTQFFPPVLGSAGPAEPADLPLGELVVKPAVSSGALDTSLYGASDSRAAASHVRSLQLEGRTAIVQPYRHKVDEEAETGLVFLGQHFSHAIRKESMLRAEPASVPGYLREIITSSRSASDIEREIADAVLDAVPGGRDRLLYARVDLIPGPRGPELIELEVTEPSLYLGLGLGAADRFAAAIVERLGW
jgi:glutathione synthase/RimK-type ligase-like ATP-grasp enzyme